MAEKEIMETKIYLSKPYFKKILEKSYFEDQSIVKFEKRLDFFFERHVAALNSGTSAIHLALILAGVKKDDFVICQSFTFVATTNPILYLGANPIFIDSEIATWSMCPILLEEAIKNCISKKKKPKAIIVNYNYGMPFQIDEIVSIANFYNIKLIEDAASALGTTYKDQKSGTFGDFGIMSFNNNKILTTFGGGILICKTEKEKKKAVFLATQARDDAPHYQHSEIGYNYRMSNVAAGIGRGQMEVLDKHVGLRRKNNEFYKALFKDIDGVTVFSEPTSDYFSNHWLSCILVDVKKAGFSKEELRLQLLADNIESRPLWKPMHLQPVFKDCEYFGESISENLFDNGLCLPSGSNLLESDLERIKVSINKLI